MTDMAQRAAKTIAEAISLLFPDPNAPLLNLRNQASRRDLAEQMLTEGLTELLRPATRPERPTAHHGNGRWCGDRACPVCYVLTVASAENRP